MTAARGEQGERVQRVRMGVVTPQGEVAVQREGGVFRRDVREPDVADDIRGSADIQPLDLAEESIRHWYTPFLQLM